VTSEFRPVCACDLKVLVFNLLNLGPESGRVVLSTCAKVIASAKQLN
jgi:hypothetical protein